MNFIKMNYNDGCSKYEYHTDDMVFYGDSEDDVVDQNHKFKMINDIEYRVYMDEENAKELEIEYIKSKNFGAGMVSLVGINTTKYPVGHGNYWSIIIDGNEYEVINMWYENFKEAVNIFDIKIMRFAIVNGLCIIDDTQIPLNWYLDNLFMKYNCRAMSFVEKEKLNNWYHSNIKNF